jgi:competence protein ComFC
MTAPNVSRRPLYRIYQLAWSGLDWLYPPQCGGCGEMLTRWCQACEANVRLDSGWICSCCGQPLSAPGVCRRCRECPPAFTALRSWGAFGGPLRNALHRLKYQRDIALGEVLARQLVSVLQGLDWPIDLICPTPIGVARKAERGYNQATFLALPLALALGLPYRPQALTKTRETRSQVGLSADQRQANVSGAFQGQAKWAAGRTVLVVDDVTTTGATIQACAAALLQAGARQVYGLTLARAV